jgi:hypothetical protein
VVFLDSDDRLRSDAVAIQAEYLLNDARLAWVAGSCELIDSNGERLGEARPPSPPRTLLPENSVAALLRRCLFWTTAAVMFRRNVLGRAAPFDPGLRAAEDYELYFWMSHRFPVRIHGEVVVSWRRHARNVSRDPVLMWSETLDVYRRQWEFTSSLAPYREALRSGVMAAERRYAAALRARSEGDGSIDLTRLLCSLSGSPGAYIAELALAKGRTAERHPHRSEQRCTKLPLARDEFERFVLRIHAELLKEAADYIRMLRTVRDLIAGPLQRDVIAVLSGGDHSLLGDSDRSRHFPGRTDGTWSGFHPASSQEALAALYLARGCGATALVVPGPFCWWLRHYVRFSAHLNSLATDVLEKPDGTMAFRFPSSGRGAGDHDSWELICGV